MLTPAPVTPVEARVKALLRRVLRGHGVDRLENQGLHAWRCQYPDRYGQCSCFDQLVDELTRELFAITKEASA